MAVGPLHPTVRAQIEDARRGGRLRRCRRVTMNRCDIRFAEGGRPYVIDVNGNCDLGRRRLCSGRLSRRTQLRAADRAHRACRFARTEDARRTPPPCIRPAARLIASALRAGRCRRRLFRRRGSPARRDIIDEALSDPGPKLSVSSLSAVTKPRWSATPAIRTPFTRAASDLYWLATHPEHRRGGAAAARSTPWKRSLRGKASSTSASRPAALAAYSAARAFYQSLGCENIARIPDFYKPGDALYTYYKRPSGGGCLSA